MLWRSATASPSTVRSKAEPLGCWTGGAGHTKCKGCATQDYGGMLNVVPTSWRKHSCAASGLGRASKSSRSPIHLCVTEHALQRAGRPAPAILQSKQSSPGLRTLQRRPTLPMRQDDTHTPRQVPRACVLTEERYSLIMAEGEAVLGISCRLSSAPTHLWRSTSVPLNFVAMCLELPFTNAFRVLAEAVYMM